MRRLALSCSHRPPCPGCPRFGVGGVDPGALAALSHFAARAHLPPPSVCEGAQSGFRHRARLSVRGRAQNPKIGIFEEGSHRVVHVPSCVVHHPLINTVTRGVRDCLVELRVAPYSDQAHLGTVRAVQLAVERASQTVQLVLVTRNETPNGLEGLFDAVRRRVGDALHSLWWNGHPERTNTVLGPHFEKICGPDSIVEDFDGVAVHYPPGAFGQNNLPLFHELARHVRSFVPDGARVLELYAGTGAIGVPLARRLTSLHVNEVSEASLAGLHHTISGLPPDLAARIVVVPGSAATAATRVASADVVIADPPRKGLDAEVLDAVQQSPPPRFVYVSCGLTSFLEQAERLLESGAFTLSSLAIFALFPFTEHVETVAVFDRAGSPLAGFR
jgi:23S rRNA (uracil1939-C5)-methyltransferase